MADAGVIRATLLRLLDDGFDSDPQAARAWLQPMAPLRFAAPLREPPASASDARLDAPPDACEPAGPLDETTARGGDVVGPYRLIREIAGGGMGSVWMAERVDGALQRQVALKLPRLAWGAGLAERMARERDIGALLEHPHIARLYDAGVDQRGRPFLAFEYIAGERIDAWCARHDLSIRARLRLFLQVAQAVAHAHARLVVHRDLKPSNVLVDGDGAVHLLDFGIAKLLRDSGADETGLTQLMGQAMTPHYASPEQLRGEPVTVASDVYSLGVLLYELLTGQRPHDPKRASIAALEEAILQGEAPAASRRVADRSRAHALSGDVDAILAKALCREPERRYPTVDAMADDVRRHLAGEPVSARPATAWYRLRKFVARHRMGVGAGATVGLAAIVATAVIVVQTQRARAEARQGELVKQFVIDAFRASVQGDEADDAGGPSSFERLLERNAQLIDRAGSPELEAQLYGIVAGLLLDAKSFDAAAVSARSELALLEQAQAPAAERADATLRLAQALLGNGRVPEAQAQARHALELAGGEGLAAARARLQLAAALAEGGQLDAALGALDLAEAGLGTAAVPVAAERARALALRASVLDARGDPVGAQALLARAVETAETAGAPAQRTALDLRLELARHRMLRGEADAARAALAPVLEAARAAGGPAGVDAALVDANMGALALYAGSTGVERQRALEAIERERAAVAAQGAGASPTQLAWADLHGAAAALARGRNDEAHELASRAGAVLLPLVRDRGDRLLLLSVLARADLAAGRTAAAQPVLHEWQELARAHFPGEAWRATLAGTGASAATGGAGEQPPQPAPARGQDSS